MKTLVVYATKYGCTEKCATKLAAELLGEVKLHNLKDGIPALDEYNQVVIGGSIYMGQIQKEVAEFCKQKEDELQIKGLGLFIVCMREGEMAQEQLNTVYPKGLSNHAKAKGIFGGEFIFSKMSFMDKLITKVIAKTSADVSNIDHESIYSFAEKMGST